MLPGVVPFPPEVRAKALQLRSTGLSFRKVAAECGCSDAVVRAWCSQAAHRSTRLTPTHNSQPLSPPQLNTQGDQQATVSDVPKRTHSTLAEALQLVSEQLLYDPRSEMDIERLNARSVALERCARAGAILHRFGEDPPPSRITLNVGIILQGDPSPVPPAIEVESTPPVVVETEKPGTV